MQRRFAIKDWAQQRAGFLSPELTRIVFGNVATNESPCESRRSDDDEVVLPLGLSRRELCKALASMLELANYALNTYEDYIPFSSTKQ